MWNNKQQTDDDSWEVRAFEEDTTGNIMGCTWPPRSYTCTFCRREFRSAQALGGHMNVHRRDRARMHDPPPPLLPPSPTASNKSPLLIPTQDLLPNGLCILYTLPNPNPNPNTMNGITMDSQYSSPLLSINVSPFTTNIRGSSLCHSSNNEPVASNNNIENECMNNVKDLGAIDEELDLELRLGPKSTSPVEGSR